MTWEGKKKNFLVLTDWVKKLSFLVQIRILVFQAKNVFFRL